MSSSAALQQRQQQLVLYEGPTTPAEISDDLYALLGVPRNAKLDRITDAYRKFALRYHPDRPGVGLTNHAMFQAVNAAHKVLSDKRKRRMYDALGHSGLRTLDLLDNAPAGTLASKLRAQFDRVLNSGSTHACLLRALQASFGISFIVLWHAACGTWKFACRQRDTHINPALLPKHNIGQSGAHGPVIGHAHAAPQTTNAAHGPATNGTARAKVNPTPQVPPPFTVRINVMNPAPQVRPPRNASGEPTTSNIVRIACGEEKRFCTECGQPLRMLCLLCDPCGATCCNPAHCPHSPGTSTGR